MANATYLIDHWSYSSMKDFLGNRYKFLLTYVLKTWKFKTGVSGLVGKAGHKAIEVHLKGASIDAAIQHGFDYINGVQDGDVNWGKTGSREDAIKTYTFAINSFFSEMPEIQETLGIEESLTEIISPVPETVDDPFEFTIPAKCVVDHLERTPEGIIINDWKFVKSYTDPEEEKPMRLIQALFNFHPVRAKYGQDPIKMRFHECKTSKNKDGSPQVQVWEIDFRDMRKTQREYFATFYRLYDLCSKEISKEDVIFLPNISDIMDGEETFQLFAGETFGVDRPTVVRHKLEEVELKERKYVPSAPDRVENKHLTEEEKVRLKLQEFGMAVEMKETFKGLNIIKYTLKPSRGQRMSDFARHEKDIAIALEAESVRIEAPIMGTSLVGIEVPNPERTFVQIPEEVLKPADGPGKLIIPVGVDVYGKTVTKDLADMPHLLVAGATGSGKSVFINVLIKALVSQNTASQLKLVLIDPKRVELSAWKGVEHLLCKPIYEVPEANKALLWLTDEMEERYRKLEGVGARNIDEYNAQGSVMEKIVVVIDEFADLMLQEKATKVKGFASIAETAIVRLAQKARAVGIHLVLGTQRPSVDVVTGLIKANIPTRVAFSTSSETDSRIILDESGAEMLMGKGDMLFLDPAKRGLTRLQSFYV